MRYDIAIAVAFIVIAVIAMILYGSRRKQVKLQIFQHGTTITALITHIDQRQEVVAAGGVVSHAHPIMEMHYYITAEWSDPQTQTNYSFLSDPLTSLAPEVKIGDTIQVKIDPAHPDKGYFVDVSTIISI